jgi:hypothetical protein
MPNGLIQWLRRPQTAHVGGRVELTMRDGVIDWGA